MNPATIALIIGLVEQAIQDTPQLITEFQAIFAKTNPTPADWATLKALVQSETFASLAPDAKLQ